MKFSRYILINISFLRMFHFSLPRFTRYARFRSLDSCFRGDNEIRTRDPLLARQVLSQLSYTPVWNYSLSANGLKWTRTIDLTLIRRAL